MFTTYKLTPTSNFANIMYKYLLDTEQYDDVTIVTNNKTIEQERGAWKKIIKEQLLSQSPHA